MLCFQLVDKFAPPPLRPQKVDVAKVSFGLLSLNIFLLSSGGKRARLRCVPPRPILHYCPHESRVISLADFVSEVETLERSVSHRAKRLYLWPVRLIVFVHVSRTVNDTFLGFVGVKVVTA